MKPSDREVYTKKYDGTAGRYIHTYIIYIYMYMYMRAAVLREVKGRW